MAIFLPGFTFFNEMCYFEYQWNALLVILCDFQNKNIAYTQQTIIDLRVAVRDFHVVFLPLSLCFKISFHDIKLIHKVLKDLQYSAISGKRVSEYSCLISVAFWWSNKFGKINNTDMQLLILVYPILLMFKNVASRGVPNLWSFIMVWKFMDHPVLV